MAVHGMNRSDFRAIMDAFKTSVHKAQKKQFTPNEMKALALLYKQRIIELHGPDAVPVSLKDQLQRIIVAIQDSWDNFAMRTFRNNRGMSHEEGTAIIIQAMVKGNYSATETGISGAGARFLRQVAPWEDVHGSFAYDIEGSDIADGVITPLDIDVLRKDAPMLFESNQPNG